jgi:DNA repair protein RadA/Sms
VELTRLDRVDVSRVARLETGLGEFDRVLGGGLVPGGVVLIGGDPGIGKSTLLLRALANLAARTPCCYVTGEESLDQIGLRAQRLGVGQAPLDLLAETCVETVLTRISTQRELGVLAIDSIQTLFSAELQSAPGSVSTPSGAPCLAARGPFCDTSTRTGCGERAAAPPPKES